MKKLRLFVMALCCSAVLAAKAPDTIHVGGSVAKPGSWSVSRLEREFNADIQTVEYTLKGAKHTARCVPLLTLIEASQPKIDPKRKNHRLAFVAVVKGRDGYTVGFSMGELLPENGKGKVWIALDEDGKPLPEKDAPVRLLVPAEEKPNRWVFGVKSITVKDAGK